MQFFCWHSSVPQAVAVGGRVNVGAVRARDAQREGASPRADHVPPGPALPAAPHHQPVRRPRPVPRRQKVPRQLQFLLRAAVVRRRRFGLAEIVARLADGDASLGRFAQPVAGQCAVQGGLEHQPERRGHRRGGGAGRRASSPRLLRIGVLLERGRVPVAEQPVGRLRHGR